MGSFLRSCLFNIAFYVFTLVVCVFLLFTFVLPRKQAFRWVRLFYFQGIGVLERIFLGLDYRVQGCENLPASGSYVLALKHYSTYETLKLPVIFGDIAIIMKRELTWIPLWGWYTKKLEMIPVDRGARGKAVASLIAGAKRVIADHRPILIFPQGTRVSPNDTTAEKPYKVGIAKIAETLNLPVVPVALNSGAFWPKHSFLKKSGVVDFKILPAIPAGLSASETLKRLEAALEPESRTLMEKADFDMKRKISGWVKALIALLVLLFAGWYAWWHFAASSLERRLAVLPAGVSSPYKPSIDGFPFALDVLWPDVTYQSPSGTLHAPALEALIWPLPGGHVDIITPNGFTLEAQRQNQRVHFEAQSFAVKFALPQIWKPREQWAITFKTLNGVSGATSLSGKGNITVPVYGAPANGSFSLNVEGYNAFLQTLVANNLVPADKARLAGAFLDTMAAAQQSRALSFPVNVKDDVVYVGFIRLMSLADMRPPAGGSGLPRQKIRSGGWVTDAPPAPAPQMMPVPPPPQ